MHRRMMIPNLQVVLVMNPKPDAALARRSLPFLAETIIPCGQKTPCNRLVENTWSAMPSCILILPDIVNPPCVRRYYVS